MVALWDPSSKVTFFSMLQKPSNDLAFYKSDTFSDDAQCEVSSPEMRPRPIVDDKVSTHASSTTNYKISKPALVFFSEKSGLKNGIHVSLTYRENIINNPYAPQMDNPLKARLNCHNVGSSFG